MSDLSSIRELKNKRDTKGLSALRTELKGPVQLIQVHSALAEVWETQENWEEATEAWRECLVLSPGNPELWERMGDAAVRAGRMPLGISALQNAYEISRNFQCLLKVAKARLLIHDYANVLALVSFISQAKPDLSEATELRETVLNVMRGKTLFQGNLMRLREAAVAEPPEKLVFKVANLTGFAKTLRRQLELGKDDSILIFQRVPIRDTFELTQASSRTPIKKTKNPLMQLHQLAEDLKREVLTISEPTVLPLFGLNPLPNIPNFKSKCGAEPQLDEFLEKEWRLSTVIKTLVTNLCGNRPRPSAALSDELGWEVLHLYLVSDPPLDLQDESLTLFELALKDSEHASTLQKLQTIALEKQDSYHSPELKIRLKYALAWFYYHIGEEKTKAGDQVNALLTAFALLEEVETMLMDQTLFLWWYGKVLSKSSLQMLKENIKDELMLLKIEDSLKQNPKAVQTLLSILTTLCALLKKRCAKDDPAFYWRKVKLLLKPLLKCVFTPPEQLLFSQCMAEFLGILQYNLEDGSKLSRDIDLRLIFKTVVRSVFTKCASGLRQAHEAYITLAAINIVKAKTDLISELPFVVKKVLLSSESLAEYFLRFHAILSDFPGGEKDLHFTLCKAYEKPVSLSGNVDAMNIIYSQLYGFSVVHKDCCKGKTAPPDTSFPKSLGKLKRMVEYTYRNSPHLHEQDLGIYFPQTYDKDISPALERCIIRLPGLFFDCPHLKVGSQIVNGLISSGKLEFEHVGCGSVEAKTVAELFYERYAADSYELALMKEAHPTFLSLLDTVESLIEKFIVLNPSNGKAWLLYGQVCLHKWMAGYYDSAVLGVEKSDLARYADTALSAFGIVENIDPATRGHVNLVRGLIQFLRYRLTHSGLFEAETCLDLAVGFMRENESLEMLMITALVKLHIKSDQAQVLFDHINQESKGKYSYLCKIAAYKLSKTEENWKELEVCPQQELYLSYVLAKKQPDLYQDRMVLTPGSFFSSSKVFETKVLDRCLAFPQKKAKIAQKYIQIFFEIRQISSLLSFSKELSVLKVPVFDPIFQDSVQKLVSVLKQIDRIEDMKLFYEAQDFISSCESLPDPLKVDLGTQLTDALAVFHGLFGAEACESLKPTKRRRKK